MDNKYTLSHGIHRGTITSRDTGRPETFGSAEAARAKLEEHRKWYRSIGYAIWFAEITDPTGKKIHYEGNSNYR